MASNDIINGFDFSALPIRVELVGRVDSKEWPHFLWNVTFRHAGGFWTFPYKCGLAHATPSSCLIKSVPIPPSNADILHCVIQDAEAAHQSFDDWCSDLGANNDSIKDFRIYRECCESAVHLRKTFTREQLDAMRAALQDY